MNAAQLEQYRDLLARMSKTRTADAATTDALVLAVADLVEEVERLQAQLAAVPVDAMRLLLWGDATQPGYANAVGTVGDWLIAEQDAANAAAELRAPTYGGGCW